MSTRITDLEEFALRHIWRPYQNKVGFEDRLERLPMSLEETVEKIVLDDSGWSDLVLSRIAAIGFRFPSYVVHPLVDLVVAEQKRRKGGAA